MSPCVLDTSVASLLFRQSPLLAPYQPYLATATPWISFQTVAEMRFGALKARWGSQRVDSLERFLSSLSMLTYSDALAHLWAETMVEAERAGRRLESGDAWVAATARLLSAPLLTHDRDFDVQSCPSVTVYRHLP